MNITPLSKQAQATLGATEVWSVTDADLTLVTADGDQTLTVPAADGELFQVVAHKLVTPFKDASDAAFNSTKITIGDGGDADRLMAATELNANGAHVDYGVGTGAAYAFNAADTVDLLIESMAAKSLVNIDTGELHLYVKRINLADLTA